ncbi:MAG: leucine-rich repeat protein [Clostridiaceae bacterium]|nr:leucine-rich repeat protein [Clostridiaceae bacterium]
MKKALSIILAVIMIISVLPLTAFALDMSYTDMESNGWWYRYYYSGYAQLSYYEGDAVNVVVPDHIGAVPVTGFTDENTARILGGNVKSITFELQVSEIPTSFARNRPALESVTLPDTVARISNEAFYYCRNLSSINLPSGLKYIEDKAFYSCTSLTGLTFPSTLISIGDNAFSYCSSLKTVNFNNGLKSVGASAFSACYALESVILPDSVIQIGNEAFFGCTSIESAVLPNNLPYVPQAMFADCFSLKTVTIPESVQSVQYQAFKDCYMLDNVTLPSNLRLLYDDAFRNCRALQSIYIPGSVSNIGAYAFYCCLNLQSVTIGYGLKTIGESYFENSTNGHVFEGCEDETSITVPSSVITVYDYSFGSSDYRYLDGEKRFLDRIDFENPGDKNGFHYRVPVSFTTEHGTAPATVYPYNGSQITLPSLTAQGYTFGKWKDAANNEYNAGSSFTVPDNPVTLSAVWTAKTNIITFYTSKGVTPAFQIVPSGNKVIEPAGQIVFGEYIEGWYKNSDFSGEKYDFSETVLDEFALYAKWVTAPSVTVNITGGGAGNQVVFRDRVDSSVIFATVTQPTATLSVPADAVMEITAASGYSYSGSIQSEIPMSGGAQYLRITDIINGQSSYAFDYGSHSTVNVTFSSTPTVSVNITADGITDTSGLWTLTDGYAEHSNYTAGSTVNVPTGGIASEDDKLTLTLNVPDGYGCDGTIINGGSTIKIIDGTTSYSFLPAGDVTLNLHFYSRQNYTTLYFRNTNNSDYFTQKYLKTESAFTLPENTFSNSHGIFNSWNTSSDGTGDSYNPNAEISLPAADTAYYAIWDAAYYMSFNKNSGTGSMSRLYCLTTDPILTVPECGYVRNGYAFTGWNTKSSGSGTTYQPNDNVNLSADMTLYAQWTRSYTVNLHSNFGNDETVRQEIPRGNSENILANPYTREGYIFLGWNTAADGSGTAYADGETITPTGSLILYAQWISVDSYIGLYDDATVKINRDDGFIYNLSYVMRMPHLLSQFSNNHEQIRILDKDGNTLGFSDYIATGATVRLFDETYNTVVLDELALVIYGDVNGDSAVDAFDLFECDKALHGLTTLSGAYHEAADVNGDGVFNLNDYARLKAVTGGTAEIDQSIER